MTSVRSWLASIVAGSALGGLASCWIVDDPSHCSNNGVPCPGSTVCDPCTPSNVTPNGCVDASDMVDQSPDAGCQAGTGGMSGELTTNEVATNGTVETAESAGTGLETAETESETGGGSTTGPPGCMGTEGQYAPECPGDLPFCVGGICVGCDDPDAGACTAAAGGEVCDGSGACVECNETDESACEGTSPICGEDNLCTACTAHDQCPGDAGCHIFEGSCLPEDMVLTVGSGESVASAIGMIGVGERGTIHIGSGTYIGNVLIPVGSVIALLGNNNVTLAADNGVRTVELVVGSTAYLAGLMVQNYGAGPVIESDGDLRLDDMRVGPSVGDGVISTEGRVHLENTRITNNAGFGLQVGGMEPVVLRNVILVGNGTVNPPQGFVTTGITPYTIVYSTIADNLGTTGGAISSPAGMGEIRNSILVSDSLTDSVTIGMGATLTIENSVVADDDFSGANGNIPVRMLSDLGFEADWGISTDSIAQDVAVWQMGDPLVDIDGDDRPGMMGAMDYAGADRPD